MNAATNQPPVLPNWLGHLSWAGHKSDDSKMGNRAYQGQYCQENDDGLPCGRLIRLWRYHTLLISFFGDAVVGEK